MRVAPRALNVALKHERVHDSLRKYPEMAGTILGALEAHDPEGFAAAVESYRQGYKKATRLELPEAHQREQGTAALREFHKDPAEFQAVRLPPNVEESLFLRAVFCFYSSKAQADSIPHGRTGGVNQIQRYETLSQEGVILGLADYVTRIFLTVDPGHALEQLNALLQRMVRRRQKRRPGRPLERISFRPRLRRGPGGRCGAERHRLPGAI